MTRRAIRRWVSEGDAARSFIDDDRPRMRRVSRAMQLCGGDNGHQCRASMPHSAAALPRGRSVPLLRHAAALVGHFLSLTNRESTS